VSKHRAIAHLADGSVKEITSDACSEVLGDGRSVLWLDIQDPAAADIETLREEFHFHELALEDALRGGQRPKLDQYSGYYFIVLYTVDLADGDVGTHEIHCFWGKNYLVTLHAGAVAEIDAAIQRWASSQDRRKNGVAYQMYALLDAVIDAYFPVLDGMSDRIDAVEERIFDGDGMLLREVFSLRRQLIDTRRVLAPMRDVINELIRRDVPVFPPALVPYLADVYDHTVRGIDTLDLHRDLLTSVIETQLSVTSNRLNQTMRTLTALTIAIMVPTLIAGIYGMNFRNMPELDWPWGYAYSLILMLVSLVGLLALFKRMDWL